MKKNRWKEISRLYYGALDLPEGEREAFLNSCEDENLRQEVLSLLADESLAKSFLEEPALGVASKLKMKERQSLIGRQLGPYQLISELGRGGMGEVYEAKDTKLGRNVAIKVLSEEFAKDEMRIARFRREAKLLASLNHPNIAALYELEESDGMEFLVLECVSGETLAERIKRGRIPIDDALPLFRQIAEALEAAHEKGIIHRDLKPANIKVTPEGNVKVLDFGLAKALAREIPAQGLTQSTVSISDATETGVLLGTAPYMSPEQARGNAVDRRADIWAFGCCLHESLSGRATFLRKSASETIAAILKEEPGWQSLPDDTPPGIRNLLRRCLAKDPNHRLQHIGDARVEIEEAIELQSRQVPKEPRIQRTRRMLVSAKIMAVLAVAAVLSGLLFWFLPNAGMPPAQNVTRVVITLPDGLSLSDDPIGVAISPDGKEVVFVATGGGGRRLYSWPMQEEFEAKPIPGTDGACSPFFSPDSQWIGFFAEGKLKKVKFGGAVPITLCDFEHNVAEDDFYGIYSSCATWGADDNIYLTHSQTPGLSRVSAEGGEPEAIAGIERRKDELRYNSPQLLPGGHRVLFTISIGGGYSNDSIVAASLDTGERRTLIKGGTRGRYVESGHLMYFSGESLMAVPFNLKQMKVAGPPLPLPQQRQNETWLPGNFSTSKQGILVYVKRQSVSERELIWVDRHGNVQPIPVKLRMYWMPRLSPDGRRLCLTATDRIMKTWILDLERGDLTLFGSRSHIGVWTPDGKRIAFSSNREGHSHNLFWQPADGSGAAERLTTSDYHEDPASWSPDGKVLAFARNHPNTGWDIWLLHMDGRREEPFLVTNLDEFHPMISPDGRWIAYVSSKSGTCNVYVQSFPDRGREHPISTGYGNDPLWSPNGKELFYRDGNKVMAVAVETDPVFDAKKPELLFEAPTLGSVGYGSANYDITKDGRRFIMIRPKAQPIPTQIHVVLNWFEELKQRAPVK
jgi:serine/threonine protein kinase/Tol biopolymer transport system component